MFYVYILRSLKTDRFYIGYSQNPEARLTEHNSGKVVSTRNQRPWIKVYQESLDSEILAIQRERYIKKMKSRKFIGPKKKAFVLITLEQYNAMEETAHLLSTQANTNHLMESIAQDKAGQITDKSLIEPKRLSRKTMSKK